MENKLSTPQISTLMAEIRIVKIGNKQMTISVFNQLYQERCFDLNCKILYPVWGKVNRDSLNYIIFQKGNELRKMMMPLKFGTQRYLITHTFQDNILNDIEKMVINNGLSVETYDKMVDKLNNSQQLFIAV